MAAGHYLHKYPQELGQKQFPHCIKFYINARKVVAQNNNLANRDLYYLGVYTATVYI